jgi:hypothetical protein
LANRLPGSRRTREELTALIEGQLSTASAKDELVKLATRLIVEEALEGEAGDALGRDYYQHGAHPSQGGVARYPAGSTVLSTTLDRGDLRRRQHCDNRALALAGGRWRTFAMLCTTASPGTDASLSRIPVFSFHQRVRQGSTDNRVQ